MGEFQEYRTGRWRVYYSYEDPNTGKKKRWMIYSLEYRGGWISLRDERMAKDLLTAINREISDPNIQHNPYSFLPNSGGMLAFSKQAELYKKQLESDVLNKQKKPLQQQKITHYFDKYFIPFFKDIEVTKIKGFHLADLVNNRLPAKWSIKQRVNVMGFLRTFFVRQLIPDVVMTLPKWPDIGTPAKKPITWIEWATIEATIKEIADKHRGVFWCGFGHGLRPGEAVAIEKADFDFRTDMGSLLIQRSRWNGETTPHTKNNGYRAVPINPLIREKMETIARGIIGDKTLAFPDPDTGEPYTHAKIRYHWLKACKKTGAKISLRNAMRGSWAMAMANSGKSIQAVSAALGHADIRVTQRYFEMLTEATGRDLYGDDNVVEVKFNNKGKE
jgi:integrase